MFQSILDLVLIISMFFLRLLVWALLDYHWCCRCHGVTTDRGSDRGLVRAWRPRTAYKHALACFCTYFLSFLSLVSSYSAIHTVALLLYMPGRHKNRLHIAHEKLYINYNYLLKKVFMMHSLNEFLFIKRLLQKAMWDRLISCIWSNEAFIWEKSVKKQKITALKKI